MRHRAEPRPPATRPLAWIVGGLGLALLLSLWALSSRPDGAGHAQSPQPAPRPIRSPGARRTAPPDEATEPVRGRVEASGSTVPNAWVCAARSRRGTGRPRQPSACVRSDENGAFSVHLEVGRYVLWASAPGFVPAPGPRGYARVEIGRRSTTRDVVLLLVPGGKPLAGRVTDALGGAVEGGWVTALGRARGDAPPAASAITGPDGRFQLWLHPGPVDVVVRADGYATATIGAFVPDENLTIQLWPEGVVEGRILPSQGLAADLATMAVTARRIDATAFESGRSTPVDPTGRFRLGGLAPGTYELRGEGPGACTQIPPAVRVTPGGVHTADVPVQPCASVVITVRTKAPSSTCDHGTVTLFALGGGRSRQAAVAGGRARLAGVAPGPYRVEVTCAGNVAPVTDNRDVAAGVTEQTWEFVLERRWQDTGALAGRVVSHDGAPVAHAVVEVPLGPLEHTRQTTDYEGRFFFPDLPARRLAVHARGPSGLTSAPASIEVVPDRTAELELRLAAPGRVRGRVVDADTGQPVPDAWVELDGQGGPGAGSRTDRDGRFTADDLAASTYRVSVANARVVSPEEIQVPAGTSVDAEILVDTMQCDLTVRVVDGSGAAVPDVVVEARSERPNGITVLGMTAADGRASLEGMLDEPYRIVAIAPSGGEAEIRLDPCEAHEPTLTLSDVAALDGLVVTADGQPVPYAVVGIRSEGGRNDLRTATDGTGRFHIEAVPAGVPLVAAARSGSGRGRLRIAPLTAGERAQVEIRVQPTVTAIGRVLDPRGEPVPHAWIVPQLPDGAEGDAVGPGMGNLTGDDGRFTLTHVPTGPLEVMVTAPGHRPGFVRVHVPSAPPHDVGALLVAPDAPPRSAADARGSRDGEPFPP